MSRDAYIEAMIELAGERGYDAVGIEEIAARAGGDAGGFRDNFPTKLDCAAAALEAIAADNLATVRGAFERERDWPDSLRAAAHAQARWIKANPKRAHFGLLEALWLSDLTGALRDNLVGAYVAMVDAGRAVASDPEAIPAHTAEGVVGSIVEVIARGLREQGKRRDPREFVPEMMYLAVRPYLGEEAARRELTIPAPADRAADDV